MKVLHDWIKDYVGEAIPSVEKFDELFTFHAFEIDGVEKVGEKDVIDVKVLPDRASDCLSHRGVARELCTLQGTEMKYDPLREAVTLEPKTDTIKISIENQQNCRRFSTALITGVTVGESPLWLKERLEALGQRSINNIVDATNYVMLGLGQPLHAYDAETLSEDAPWHFGVRMAKEGESVVTLSGDTITLNPQVQLIVNGATDVPLGIAGIKGGKSSGITESTTRIILESANFNPQITRKSSQSIQLQTDASKRFENNLSPELSAYGLTECVKLIQSIAGGVCEGYADEYPNPVHNNPVSVSLAESNALLGVALTSDVVEDIFFRLGFVYTREGDVWLITAPFERADIVIAEDVIAEIGRVYGYSQVSSIIPSEMPLREYNTRHYYGEKMRDFLVEEGFSEVITSSFRKKDEIELLNALASDKRFLRSSLGDNLGETLDKNMPNLDLLSLTQVRVFEIGTVFEKTQDGSDVTEHFSLGIGVRTKQNGYTPKDDEILKDLHQKIETVLGITCDSKIEKGILEYNFTEIVATLPHPTAYEAYSGAGDTIFIPYSTFPFISRDIALWTPEGTKSGEIETTLTEKAGKLLVRCSLFDEFTKDGRVSYAFRLVFQSFERTLTDEEINTIMESIYAEMKSRSFEIR